MTKPIRHKGVVRFFSWLLCFMLMFDTMGMTVFAETGPNADEASADERVMTDPEADGTEPVTPAESEAEDSQETPETPAEEPSEEETEPAEEPAEDEAEPADPAEDAEPAAAEAEEADSDFETDPAAETEDLDLESSESEDAVLNTADGGVFPAKGSLVYFGKKVWRVLDPNAVANDETGQAGILLISEYVLEDRLWDDRAYDELAELTRQEIWDSSDIRTYLRSTFESSLGLDMLSEKSAVITAVKNPTSNSEVGLTGDRFFLLSGEEAERADYFASAADRIGRRFNDGVPTSWMLRSVFRAPYYIESAGGRYTDLTSNQYANGLRPAFYLDPTKIDSLETDAPGIQIIKLKSLLGTANARVAEWITPTVQNGDHYTMSAEPVMAGQQATVVVTPDTGYTIEDIHVTCHASADSEPETVLSSSGPNVTATFTVPAGLTSVSYSVEIREQTITTPAIAGLSVDVNGENMPIVKFDGYDWLVIGYDGAGNYPAARDGCLTLLNRESIKTISFLNSSFSFARYQMSNAYGNCTYYGAYNEGELVEIYPFFILMSTGEKQALVGRNLPIHADATDPNVVTEADSRKFYYGESRYDPNLIIGGYVNNASFWIPSAAEAAALPAQGAGTDGYCWLRTPGLYGEKGYYGLLRNVSVFNGADVNYEGVDATSQQGFRAMCDLDLSKILFVSAADGGKQSGETGTDSLMPWVENTGREWKLTLYDQSINFSVTSVAGGCGDNQVLIGYSGATVGYISALIKDSTGAIKYYGKLKQIRYAEEVTGTVGVTISDGMLGEGDTLYVFSETAADATGNHASIASQLIPVEVPEPAAGHDWGSPEYDLAADGSTVTAKRVCRRYEGHVETETAEVTLNTNAAGDWICSATFENPAFGTWNETIHHEWGEPTYVWANGNGSVTATRTCSHDPAHIETETVSTKVNVSQAGNTWMDSGNYTLAAEFKNQAFSRQVIQVDAYQTVWYGNRAWLNVSDSEYPSGTVTLLSRDEIGSLCFRDEDTSSSTTCVYSDPMIYDHLATMLHGGERAVFSEKEEAPILPRTVRDPSQGLYMYKLLYTGSSYYGQKDDSAPATSLLWLPAIDEAYRLFESARKMQGDWWGNWWLRYVDGQGVTYRPACVTGDGTVADQGEYQVGATKGVRPAFFLDQNAVLYASPAVGGKPSGALGPDAVTSCGSPNLEWKLTLLDDGTIEGLDGHAGFTVDSAVLSGDLYTITYHGAATGPNEYISALVKDADGNVVKYGRLKSCADTADASGTVTLRTEPGLKVYVYNEQYNGDKATDYAGTLYDLNALFCSLHCYHNGVCIHCGAVTELAEVPYYDPADGTVKTFDTYSPVPETLQTMDTGVYVVTKDVTLSQRLTVTGDVQLVLMDGTILVANAGINVPQGKTLTIWGQSGLYSVPGEALKTHGTGVLNATGSNQSAAIGGNRAETAGDIFIRGGVINTAGYYGAGIGGGDIGVCGRITIDDGAVTATGYRGSAGIGGGGYSDGGFVTVNGGYVHAVGSTQNKQAAAGIGTGRPNAQSSTHLDPKTLTVNGGVVVAEAGPLEEGGTGAQAIGVNLADAPWSEVRLTQLVDGLRVTSDGVVADYDDRAVACRGQTARIEPCTEHEDDGNGLCRYCHLTSHWTVSFDAGGGSGTMNSVSVMNGGEYSLPGFTGLTPPAGAAYAGWRDVYGVVRAPGDKMLVTEDVALTAVWSETHDGVTFWSWFPQDKLPAVPGNYFLCNDVELDGEWDAPEDTTYVCLNDHKITLERIDVEEGSTLNIYDHGEGLIDGNDDCLYLVRCNGGDVNIHGGTFRAADAYCIRIKKGSGNIYNAVISADSRMGFYVDGTGLLHIYDITRSDYGLEPLPGNRYGTAVYNMGTTIIDDGTFTGNKMRASLIRNERTMIINGGTFTGNEMESTTGIVFNSGTLTVNGGTFTGNSLPEGGCAFYDSGIMTVSGNPVITGNTDTAETEINVLIRAEKTLTVGPMSAGAKIGVTMQTPPGVFAEAAEGYALERADIAHFFSDSEAYAVMLNENREGVLVDPSELPVQAETVTLNKTDLALTVGEEAVLQAAVQPDDAVYGVVNWSSSDDTVAAVDENGRVKAIKAGTAVITARVDETDVIAQCPVTVRPEATSLRLCGSNRYKTSLAIANQLKKQLGLSKFSAIVLATGADYPDALAGGYLASLKNAPIILIRADKPVSHKDNKMVAKWIKANLKSGGTIYVLGSTNAISNNHVNLVKSGFKVSRLGGKNRFGTDIEILKACGVKSGKKTFLVTTGYDYADALCASALSYPLLIVNTKKNIITKEQKDYLAKVKGSTYYILGPTSVVSKDLEKALKSYGTVKRVSTGGNAILRSVQTARQFTPEPKAAALAISTAFADGLCGGVLANKMGASLLLVKSGSESQAAAFVKEKEVTSSIVFGSSDGAVPDKSVQAVFPGIKTIATAEYK